MNTKAPNQQEQLQQQQQQQQHQAAFNPSMGLNAQNFSNLVNHTLGIVTPVNVMMSVPDFYHFAGNSGGTASGNSSPAHAAHQQNVVTTNFQPSSSNHPPAAHSYHNTITVSNQALHANNNNSSSSSGNSSNNHQVPAIVAVQVSQPQSVHSGSGGNSNNHTTFVNSMNFGGKIPANLNPLMRQQIQQQQQQPQQLQQQQQQHQQQQQQSHQQQQLIGQAQITIPQHLITQHQQNQQQQQQHQQQRQQQQQTKLIQQQNQQTSQNQPQTQAQHTQQQRQIQTPQSSQQSQQQSAMTIVPESLRVESAESPVNLQNPLLKLDHLEQIPSRILPPTPKPRNPNPNRPNLNQRTPQQQSGQDPTQPQPTLSQPPSLLLTTGLQGTSIAQGILPPTPKKRKTKPKTAKVCAVCNKVFANLQMMQEHMKADHNPQTLAAGGKTFPCPHCSRTFKRETNLKQHLMANKLNMDGTPMEEGTSMKYPFICGVCGYNFTTQERLNSHTRMFHTPRSLVDKDGKVIPQIMCVECEESFSTESLLLLHMGKIHGSLPYKCRTCPHRGFLRKDNLARHMNRAHYTCEHCDAAFPHGVALEDHKVREHEKRRPKKPEPKRICACPDCGRIFQTIKTMNDHVRALHEGRGIHCELCGSFWPDRWKLQRHQVGCKKKHEASVAAVVAEVDKQHEEEQRRLAAEAAAGQIDMKPEINPTTS